jgi:hypothetical protein
MKMTSKRHQETSAQHPVPTELRVLANLELRKRQLARELAEVLQQYQRLSQEIELQRKKWFRDSVDE